MENGGFDKSFEAVDINEDGPDHVVVDNDRVRVFCTFLCVPYQVLLVQKVDYHRSASVTSTDEQISLAWENLTVKVAGSSGSKLFGKSKGKPPRMLVNNVSGVVKPGELVAVMGASGSGKSTFLNAILFRNLGGLDVSGTRYCNGTVVNPQSMTAVSAYVQQDDLFIGTLTPREHLTFMAKVNMGKNYSNEQRNQRVDAVIKELGLIKCQNTLIGITGRIKGISGGEQKRLAFATEVLTNPPILFCDEPTSGLDSFMAANVIKVLR